MSTENKISSFAVLDLETASLPDFNFNKTNITEISIHGFRADFYKPDKLNKADDNASSCSLPRINHKLTLLFNPLMMIHPYSTDITGLDNYMLQHESSFDKNAGSVIMSFLRHLRQPVCLVAHNGNDFDFRILKSAFAKMGMEIPSDILCLDSFPTIKDLDLAREKEKETELDSFIPLKAADCDLKVEEQQIAALNNDADNLGMAKETLGKEDFTKSFEHSVSKSDEESMNTPDKTDHPTDLQRFNETTPKRPPNVENIQRKRKRSIQECSPVSTTSKPNSRKSLFPSEIKETGNYKLTSIYKRLYGNEPVIAHHAEADVITLEEIMLKYGKAFVDYAEKNAKPFSEVKKVGAR